jgi:predicted porin
METNEMKKCLSRAALAAFSSLLITNVAHADDSSVTLYGILDGDLLYLSKTQSATGGNGGKFIGFTDSGQLPSIFGLKGEEDLGGGLYAEFNLESGINIANGGFNDSNGNLFGRQAWVGLRGNFGQVRAGLQFSPFFYANFALDPRNFSQFGSGLPVYVDNALATGIFNSNALSYTSPIIAGLQGSVMFAPGGVAGDFQEGRQYSANLSYHWSGLGLFAAYYNGNAGGTSTPVPTNLAMQGRVIGATYKFGSVTAKASFTNYKMGGTGVNNNVYSGGLDYLVIPTVDLNAGVWYMVNRDDTASKSLMGAFGATYFLSKSTGVYTQVGLVNNKGNQNLGLQVGDVPTSLYAPAGTTTGVTVGMYHTF